MRVTYYAEPIDNLQHPKTLPDYESCGANWVSADEIFEQKNGNKNEGLELDEKKYFSSLGRNNLKKDLKFRSEDGF